MKKVKWTNRFHGTEAYSVLSYTVESLDWDVFGGFKRAKRLKARLIDELCPHGGVNCSCWAMVESEECDDE